MVDKYLAPRNQTFIYHHRGPKATVEATTGRKTTTTDWLQRTPRTFCNDPKTVLCFIVPVVVIDKNRSPKAGDSLPKAIYGFGAPHQLKARNYATAVHVGGGVFVTTVLEIAMRGQWSGYPPKTIRTDQWISEEAHVQGVVLEAFFSSGMELGEAYIASAGLLDFFAAQVAEQPPPKKIRTGQWV